MGLVLLYYLEPVIRWYSHHLDKSAVDGIASFCAIFGALALSQVNSNGPQILIEGDATRWARRLPVSVTR
jgi:predicted PurR-regulated permease PerM